MRNFLKAFESKIYRIVLRFHAVVSVLEKKETQEDILAEHLIILVLD
jgi:hypothetical protein